MQLFRMSRCGLDYSGCLIDDDDDDGGDNNRLAVNCVQIYTHVAVTTVTNRSQFN